jgi:hypothetical protein
MPWKVTYGNNFLCFIFKVTGIIIICMTCMTEVSVHLVCGGSRLEMQKLTAHGIPYDLFMLAYTHQDVFDYNFRCSLCRNNFLSVLKFWICLETVINTLTFCLPQGHMNIVKVVFKSVCVYVVMIKKHRIATENGEFFLCGLGRN